MSNITPEDAVYHIVNSMDNDNSNHYVDEQGYQWSVYDKSGVLRLVVTDDNDEIVAQYNLVPELL